MKTMRALLWSGCFCSVRGQACPHLRDQHAPAAVNEPAAQDQDTALTDLPPARPLTIEEIIEATAKRRDRIGSARLEKPRARQRLFGRAPIGGERAGLNRARQRNLCRASPGADSG
jgi:hypothetical protein